MVVGLAAHAESLAEARSANGEDHELLKKVQTQISDQPLIKSLSCSVGRLTRLFQLKYLFG